MKICFIMYPWERVNPKQDSTLRMIHELCTRGHEVAVTHPPNLTIRDSVTLSLCKTIVGTNKVSTSIPSFYKSVEFTEEMKPLKHFDVIFMRDNPPMDPLVLNFLDSIKDDVFILNAVDGLRETNNKIYTAAYYDPKRELIPTTHVSKNIEYLLRIIEESVNDKMILKPLDGYGGSGVIVIEKSAMHNIKSLLDFYINRTEGKSSYVILQEYVEGAEGGDVRVLMLNGEPIGALRRRPAKGDARSNISAGGTVEKYKLTKADKILCRKVGEKLVRDGIYYAGLDLIGGKLIEVNVMSPGTITDINKLNNTKIQRKIVDYLELVVEEISDRKNKSELIKIDTDEYNRWFEEDPFTGDFIASMPITLIGHDSRFEYDLNRRPEECILETAWGKNVWKKKLTPKGRQKSIQKHSNYYKVTHALITKLEELFGGCIVYDMHSYNQERWGRKVPLFNIGAERVDMNRYGSVVEHWRSELEMIKLENIENVSAINDVFYGRGYNLEYITDNFKNTLVLATEIKKVYCNELTGDDYPNIIKSLQQQLKIRILNNANFFSQKNSNWKHNVKSKLLDNTMESSILKVDNELYRLLKNFELLAFINPNNNIQEKKRFFKNQGSELPKFKYSPIKINSFELKQELSNPRVQDISDVSIRHMYESVINSYFDKIDLLSSLNTPKFLYNSLRYFGRPSKKDIQNAHYFLHLPVVSGEPKRSPSLGVDEAMISFKEGLEMYGFESKIEKSNRVIAQVMVLNAKKTILFNPTAKFTRGQINALVEHEIGVHMVTTMNSNAQKLHLFNLGLPVNTMTQEGLAILAEYLSGNISMKRLKKLAYRVIVVDMMCNGADFIECYNFLVNDHNLDQDDAFSVVTRIFRGGGFTKDYLYLSGFVNILRMWEKGHDLEPLLVGKTSLEFHSVINEMIQREMVQKPIYITSSFKNPELNKNDEIYKYILSGLK